MAQLEHLIVLDEATGASLPAEISVLHQISDRMFLAQIDDETADRLRNLSQVIYVGLQPPEDLPVELTPTERLFVDGWHLRSAEKPDRPGEGLSWDAEGMTPPDLPPRGP